MKNFINCPEFVAAKNCEDAKEMITTNESCGDIRNGKFLTDMRVFLKRQE